MKTISWTDRMAAREDAGDWGHIPIQGRHDDRRPPTVLVAYMITAGSVVTARIPRQPLSRLEVITAMIRGTA